MLLSCSESSPAACRHAVEALQMPSTSPRSMARNTSDEEGNPAMDLELMPSSALSAFG